MGKKRNRQHHPTVGGVVNRGQGDSTRTARRDAVKVMTKELRKKVREQIKLPTIQEVKEIGRTKGR